MAYTIDDLNALVQAASGDELPIWDVSATGNEEPTKKITLQNLAVVIKTLASLLGTGDVVDNLTSTATDKPLSANMGKELKDSLIIFRNISISANLASTTRGVISSTYQVPSGYTPIIWTVTSIAVGQAVHLQTVSFTGSGTVDIVYDSAVAKENTDMMFRVIFIKI